MFKIPIKIQSELGLSEKTVRSRVFLSRRNILMLLAKLDRTRAGDASACTIIKNDDQHPVYPQTMSSIAVTAVEDEQYYAYRQPGAMHPTDEMTVFANEDRYAGTPEARLSTLLAELAKRFPDAHQPFQSDPPELRYLAAIDALLKGKT